ncbi:hypothetical protein C9374_014332 [Naegleria lovaniensis]|uniref:Autophagy-related protein 2 n=1 Tax=Naegleria lovaniensis TaxID=51637 RepID=A0AA88KU17_NAELO|nr:uncharacterized protein C9374_014332 [Naegleria lovaniensis]KAG2388932.1 hypothetical protein C9374_014332 [Naegleria lovaniensis]
MSGIGSWFGFSSKLTDPIKKRIFKFVIKRLLGRFIEEPDLSQLDVQLPGSSQQQQQHRKASQFASSSNQQQQQHNSFDFELKNVQLKVKEINENILMHNSKNPTKQDGIPFKLTSGYIEKICVKIPSLLDIFKESMILELNGLEVQLQFKGMNEDASGIGNAANSFLFHSTTYFDPNVLASSILVGDVTKSDIASEFNDLEDFDQQTDASSSTIVTPTTEEEDNYGFTEGHTIISQAVERVISQLKAYVTNVTVRLEFPKPKPMNPLQQQQQQEYSQRKEGKLKNVLLLHFPRLEYLDETPKTEAFGPSSFIYSFIFKGIFLQVFEEFHQSTRRKNKNSENMNESGIDNVQYEDEMRSSTENSFTNNYIVNSQPSNTLDDANTIFYGETENNRIKIVIKPSNAAAVQSSSKGAYSPSLMPTPSDTTSRLDVEFAISSIHAVISPGQMGLLLEILEVLNSSSVNIGGLDSFSISTPSEKSQQHQEDPTTVFTPQHQDSISKMEADFMVQSTDAPITKKMTESMAQHLMNQHVEAHESEMENLEFQEFDNDDENDEQPIEAGAFVEFSTEDEDSETEELPSATSPVKKKSSPLHKTPSKNNANNGTNKFLNVPTFKVTKPELPPPFMGSNVPSISCNISITLKAATFNILYQEANLGSMWRNFFKTSDKSGPVIPGIGHLSLKLSNGLSCTLSFLSGSSNTNDTFSTLDYGNKQKHDTTLTLAIGDVQASERLCYDILGSSYKYSELKILEFLKKPKNTTTDEIEPQINYGYHFMKRDNCLKHTLMIKNPLQITLDPGFIQRLGQVSQKLVSKISMFSKAMAAKQARNHSEFDFEKAFLENLEEESHITIPHKTAFEITTSAIMFDIVLPKVLTNELQTKHQYKDDKVRLECQEIKIKAYFNEHGKLYYTNNNENEIDLNTNERVQSDKTERILPISFGETNLFLLKNKDVYDIIKLRPMDILLTLKQTAVEDQSSHRYSENRMYYSSVPYSPAKYQDNSYDEEYFEHSSLDSSTEDLGDETALEDPIPSDKQFSEKDEHEDVEFSVDAIEDTILGGKVLKQANISLLVDISENKGGKEGGDCVIELTKDQLDRLGSFFSSLSQALSTILGQRKDDQQPPKESQKLSRDNPSSASPSFAMKFSIHDLVIRLADPTENRNLTLNLKKLNALIVVFSDWISNNEPCTLIKTFISNEYIHLYDVHNNQRTNIIRRDDKIVKSFRSTKYCSSISVITEISTSGISSRAKLYFCGLYLSSLLTTSPENDWKNFLRAFFASNEEKSDLALSLSLSVVVHDCIVDYKPPTPSTARAILVMDKVGFKTAISLPSSSRDTTFFLNIEGVSLLLSNNFTVDVLDYIQEEVSNKRLPRSEFGFINDLKYLRFAQIASLNSLQIKLVKKPTNTETFMGQSVLVCTPENNKSVFKSKIVTSIIMTEKEREIQRQKEPLTKVEISKGTLMIELCNDSLKTLIEVVKEISKQFPKSSQPESEPEMIQSSDTTPRQHVLYPSLESGKDTLPTINYASSTTNTSIREDAIVISHTGNILEGIDDHQFAPRKSTAVTEGLPVRKQSNPSAMISSSNIGPKDATKTEYRATSIKQTESGTIQSYISSLSSWVNFGYLTGEDAAQKNQQPPNPTIQPGSSASYTPSNRRQDDDEPLVTSVYNTGSGSTLIKPSDSMKGTLLSSFIHGDYFPKVTQEDVKKSTILPNDYPTPSFELVLKEVNIICNLYGGNDWEEKQPARKGLSESQTSDTSSYLFGEDIITSTRDSCKLVQFVFSDIYLQLDTFPKNPMSSYVSRLNLSITDLEIIDKLKMSNRNKMLKYWETIQNPRETGSGMFDLVYEVIRQQPVVTGMNETEVRIDIDILPIRLNLHQTTVEFLVDFFSKGTSSDSSDNTSVNSTTSSSSEVNTTVETSPRSSPTYFQHFHVSPINLKIDYQPVRVNLDTVKESGITSYRSIMQMVNLVPITGSEVCIKSIQLNGVSGIEEIISRSTNLILGSINTSDVFRMLLGIMPLKSVYSIGTGMADLIVLPVQSYQTDGQILRGLRRGVVSFVTNLSVGTVQLSANAASGVNYVVSSADEYVKTSTGLRNVNYDYLDDDAPPQPTSTSRLEEDLPNNINDAIQKAYKDLSTGFENAKLAVIAIPRTGNMWSLPHVVLSPLAGMTGAVANLLMGIRSELDRSYRKESEDLFKRQ